MGRNYVEIVREAAAAEACAVTYPGGPTVVLAYEDAWIRTSTGLERFAPSLAELHRDDWELTEAITAKLP